MVNNTKQIKSLLKFESEDDFYHLQIIKRKKEHPNLGSNSYVVKTYYISSIDYLDKKLDEIIALCDHHNARACINLNRRSFEKISFHLLRKITDQIMNKDFRSTRKAYESVCGTYSNESEKKWILDVDEKDFAYGGNMETELYFLQPVGEKIIDRIETKNGWHYIVKPFDVSAFKTFPMYEKIDIHKDNPTILYIP